MLPQESDRERHCQAVVVTRSAIHPSASSSPKKHEIKHKIVYRCDGTGRNRFDQDLRTRHNSCRRVEFEYAGDRRISKPQFSARQEPSRISLRHPRGRGLFIIRSINNKKKNLRRTPKIQRPTLASQWPTPQLDTIPLLILRLSIPNRANRPR